MTLAELREKQTKETTKFNPGQFAHRVNPGALNIEKWSTVARKVNLCYGYSKTKQTEKLSGWCTRKCRLSGTYYTAIII